MLDQKSAPVWMLADVMFILLVGSLFVGIAILPVAMRAVSAPVPQETDTVNLHNTRQELKRHLKQNEVAQIAARDQVDQLELRLDEALNNLQQSVAKISVAEDQVAHLQEQLKLMTATRDQCVSQLAAWQANANAAALKSKSDLQTSLKQLTDLKAAQANLQHSVLKVSVAENQVAQLQKQLKQMTATRDQSVSQLTVLQTAADAAAKKSKSELKTVQEELAAFKNANATLQQSVSRISVAENEVVELKKQLKLMTATRDQFVVQLTALQANANGAEKKSKSDLLAVQQQLTLLQGNSAAEKSVRQELLGLKGDMSRTLFVIDISASMTNASSVSYVRPNWVAGDNAWINVRRRIRDYLEFLPVGSFRILCFNQELVEHPYDTAKWCRTSEERSAALTFLDQQTPDGLTFTEAALRRAALFQPTSILLFTDGQPTRATDETQPDGTVKSVGEVDVEQQQRILKLHDEKVLTCPVNVVALNGYADPAFFSFLQELAGRTGGSFQGL